MSGLARLDFILEIAASVEPDVAVRGGAHHTGFESSNLEEGSESAACMEYC